MPLLVCSDPIMPINRQINIFSTDPCSSLICLHFFLSDSITLAYCEILLERTRKRLQSEITECESQLSHELHEVYLLNDSEPLFSTENTDNCTFL